MISKQTFGALGSQPSSLQQEQLHTTNTHQWKWECAWGIISITPNNFLKSCINWLICCIYQKPIYNFLFWIVLFCQQFSKTIDNFSNGKFGGFLLASLWNWFTKKTTFQEFLEFLLKSLFKFSDIFIKNRNKKLLKIESWEILEIKNCQKFLKPMFGELYGFNCIISLNLLANFKNGWKCKWC